MRCGRDVGEMRATEERRIGCTCNVHMICTCWGLGAWDGNRCARGQRLESWHVDARDWHVDACDWHVPVWLCSGARSCGQQTPRTMWRRVELCGRECGLCMWAVGAACMGSMCGWRLDGGGGGMKGHEEIYTRYVGGVETRAGDKSRRQEHFSTGCVGGSEEVQD